MTENEAMFLTPKQVARKYRVSVSQIYNLMRDRRNPLPNYRIGKCYRININELNEWADNNHSQAIP